MDWMAKILSKQEREVWRIYRKTKGSSYPNTKVNLLIVYPNNSYEHEKSKFDIYWEHRKQGCSVITECYLGKERCDVVCLTCNERYEPETDIKRAVRFIGRPINIVPVGWSFKDEKGLKIARGSA